VIEMAKPNPDKVIFQIGQIAMQRAEGDRQRGWSEYIRAMYQNTGSLAPRCDAKDFYAWFDEHNRGD